MCSNTRLGVRQFTIYFHCIDPHISFFALFHRLKNPANWDNYKPHNTKEYMEDDLLELEFVLSGHLTEETYGGMMNFLKATMPDTPINEIEKALVSKNEPERLLQRQITQFF